MSKQLEKKCSVILNLSFDVVCDVELANELVAEILSSQLIGYYTGDGKKEFRELKVQNMELNEFLEVSNED